MSEQETRAVAFGAVEILLVEDNPADVRLTREALASDRLWNNLSVARDGVEAMAHLRREGKFAGAARPDLILLDLNLPPYRAASQRPPRPDSARRASVFATGTGTRECASRPPGRDPARATACWHPPPPCTSATTRTRGPAPDS